MVCHADDKCEICKKNKFEIPANESIEIQGIDTEVGIQTCRTCFDNIQIAVGQISQEY